MLLLKLLKKVNIVLMVVAFSYATTYEISEPDLMTEVENKSKEAMKRFSRDTYEVSERVKSISGVYLPPSNKDYIYYVDVSKRLEEDIPKVDKQGRIVGILYRKGTVINPIDYLPVKPPDLVIFNGCRDKEVEKVKSLIKERKLYDYMLVSSGCSLKELGDKNVYKQIGRNIYILTQELKDKLQLKNTVSIASVDFSKRRVKVEVFKVVDK